MGIGMDAFVSRVGSVQGLMTSKTLALALQICPDWRARDRESSAITVVLLFQR